MDTNVVLDMARGEEFAHHFRLAFQGAGVELGCPPTVLDELGDQVANGETKELQQLAAVALLSFSDWGVREWSVPPVENGICLRFYEHLVSKRLLNPRERNDGLILAETSCCRAEYLVTSDGELLGIADKDLRRALEEMDLPPVDVVSPRLLAKRLKRIR